MRAVIQRVSEASVTVEGTITGQIGLGILVYLGVGHGDTERNADAMVDKITTLRIFPDEAGKMNRSVQEAGGGLLVVSQFTLLGDCRKGRRPSFDAAAPPSEAKRLYAYFLERVRACGLPVGEGVFQAHMDVRSLNDGPVTFVLEL
ncbi:MAG: D-tyrosyl-tRNA(Tyr) deacylase [Bryobacterales bacterium]|nr:D-tyrosyl-tRNA(Tyr) deacylase [Bryobacterales bacterium]